MSPTIKGLYQPARAKHGPCKLCGSVGKLSRTHVPARASGNAGPARRPTRVLGSDGVWRYDLGHEEDGGMWGRWFCEPCNNATGKWDEEYLRWAGDVFGALHHPSAGKGNRISARSSQLKPGAFVRALWAWMFALSDLLPAKYPDLATAVRTGAPAKPPSTINLLLGATRDLQFGILGLYRSVTVTAPPFVALLVTLRAGGRDIERRALFDTTPWLRIPADAVEAIDFELPVIHTFDEGRLPMTGTPVIDPYGD